MLNQYTNEHIKIITTIKIIKLYYIATESISNAQWRCNQPWWKWVRGCLCSCHEQIRNHKAWWPPLCPAGCSVVSCLCAKCDVSADRTGLILVELLLLEPGFEWNVSKWVYLISYGDHSDKTGKKTKRKNNFQRNIKHSNIHMILCQN